MQQEAIEVGMCRAPIANTCHVTSPNTVVAQDAMEKYTVEKVCLSSNLTVSQDVINSALLTPSQEIAHHIKRTVRQSMGLCWRLVLTALSSMRGRAQHGIALLAGTLAASSHTVRGTYD